MRGNSKHDVDEDGPWLDSINRLWRKDIAPKKVYGSFPLRDVSPLEDPRDSRAAGRFAIVDTATDVEV